MPVLTVTIPRRFRGPPESANGGYACGVVGHQLKGDASVRLHRPPPLDTELDLELLDGEARLLRGADLIANGAVTRVEPDVPGPVTFDVATEASRQYRWFTNHPFPHCFVCGPQRAHPDGLRIFAGPVADRGVVAAPWIPHASVCTQAGDVHAEIVWAVLDCPSWFALLEFEPDVNYSLLGQLAVRILRPPREAEQCIVIGWPRARERRKLYSGAALYTSAGELLAHSEATWIELTDAQLNSSSKGTRS